MPTMVAPDEALLVAVVGQVWTSMLYRPVLPWVTSWPRGRAGVQAEIDLTGDCTGTVRLWCADSAAVSMSRSLLSVEDPSEPDPVRDDVDDAIGEVLNVLAGNLKGALAGSSSLSMPRVSQRTSPELVEGHVQLTLSWHDDPVLISVETAR